MSPESKAREIAGRLRLLGEHLASAPADLRQEQLAEEIRDAVSGLSANDRHAFRRTLENEFGLAAGVARASGSDAQAETASVPAGPDQDSGTSEVKIPEGLRVLLGLPAGTTCSTNAALGVLERSLQILIAIDSVTQGTWSQVRSKPSAPPDLPGMLTRALLSESTHSGTNDSELERGFSSMQRLNTALLSALSQSGRLAHQQRAQLHPDQIESFARAEKRALGSMDAACWKKYRALAARLDEPGTESEMLKGIAEFVSSIAGDETTAT